MLRTARKSYRRARAYYRAQRAGRVLGAPAKVSLGIAVTAPIALPAVDAVTAAVSGKVGIFPPTLGKQWDLATIASGNFRHYLNQAAQAFGLGRPFKNMVGGLHDVGNPQGGKVASSIQFIDDPNAGWAVPVALTGAVAVVYDRVMGWVAGARVKIAGVTLIGGKRRK